MPAQLHLVGDGPERNRIEALVRTLGLTDEVRFLGECTDVAQVLQRSDVFLLPSETESFGLGALEAMASGVPVVASEVGGLPEVVQDRVTGFLAPLYDVEEMSRDVLLLLGDQALHTRMSLAARDRAQSHFQLEPAVDRYEAACRRVVAKASSSSRPTPS
jgi:glycosyltransferase involved in cell wall biosynthesis